jgi:hypothetical protein
MIRWTHIVASLAAGILLAAVVASFVPNAWAQSTTTVRVKTWTQTVTTASTRIKPPGSVIIPTGTFHLSIQNLDTVDHLHCSAETVATTTTAAHAGLNSGDITFGVLSASTRLNSSVFCACAAGTCTAIVNAHHVP